jgi:putative membrane protein
MTRRIAVVLAAAALFTSGVARAQSHRQPGQTTPPASEGERRRPNIPWVGGDRPATQPAPAPAPQQQPPAQPGTAQTTQNTSGQQLNDEQRRMLGTLHARNNILIASGRDAAARGQSNEVRQFGQRLQQEHTRIQGELAQLASERGVEVGNLPQASDELQANHQRLTRLQSVPNEQYDREFATALRDLGRQYEADLKRMRDATPGKDARLKSWLDQIENVAEADRLAAQQLIDGMNAQRQARTPPSSTGR